MALGELDLGKILVTGGYGFIVSLLRRIETPATHGSYREATSQHAFSVKGITSASSTLLPPRSTLRRRSAPSLFKAISATSMCVGER